jgi:hypothetical protein
MAQTVTNRVKLLLVLIRVTSSIYKEHTDKPLSDLGQGFYTTKTLRNKLSEHSNDTPLDLSRTDTLYTTQML